MPSVFVDSTGNDDRRPATNPNAPRRYSMFELEEKLRQERARHLRVINATLVGAMVGVSWSYIVEQLADPYAECPGHGCWTVIALLAASLACGILTIPAVQDSLQRTLGDFVAELEALDSRRERLSGSEEARLMGAAAVLAVERHSIFAPRSASRYGFRRAVLGKLLLLLTNAGDSAFVVTSANLLWYMTKQLEYEATGGSRFVRDELRGRTARSGRGGANFATVIAVCAGVCLAFALVSILVAIRAARNLGSETDPYRVRLWLLLSTHPHYPVAFALSIAVGVVFFAPLELGAGSDKLRAGLACLQLLLFAGGGRFVARRFVAPPADPELRVARAAQSTANCLHFLAHDVCAVLAAIGVQNFLDFALRAADLSTFLLVYAAYTPGLLVNAHFRHRRRMQKLRQTNGTDEPPSCSALADVRDAQFEDTAELWLITLGFWAPYTILLYVEWDHVIVKTSDPATTFLLRLLQQIAIAAALTLSIATLAGCIIVYRELYIRCFLSHSKASSSSTTDDDHEALQHQLFTQPTWLKLGYFAPAITSFTLRSPQRHYEGPSRAVV